MPRAARVAVASVVSAVRPEASRTWRSSFKVKSSCKLVQHAPAKLILHAGLLEFVGKQPLVVSGIGHALRLRRKRHGRHERDPMLRADRARAEGDGGNVSFPVARRLRMKRSAPTGSPDWSGCGTMEGLNSAADSGEYSCVK